MRSYTKLTFDPNIIAWELKPIIYSRKGIMAVIGAYANFSENQSCRGVLPCPGLRQVGAVVCRKTHCCYVCYPCSIDHQRISVSRKPCTSTKYIFQSVTEYKIYLKKRIQIKKVSCALTHKCTRYFFYFQRYLLYN